MMQEQSVHHQENAESNQQFIFDMIKGENMKTIDKTVLAGYNARIEKNRLRSGIGLIEFERTKEILLEKLPKSPAVIYDIGGGYGEYAWWLTSLGYEVHLFDLSEKNIEMSKELVVEYPNCHLKAAMVCDARSVPRKEKSADAILFMGPLYSITEYEERILALNHELLMNMLRQDIKDKGLIDLIKKYLKSGVMENGIVMRTDEGSSQGGNLSPFDICKHRLFFYQIYVYCIQPYFMI